MQTIDKKLLITKTSFTLYIFKIVSIQSLVEMTRFLIIALVNFLIQIIFCEKEDVFVSIESGILKGQNRGHFYSFEGIPYAEPPINDLRFASPKPYADKWKGIRNATEPGNICMQWDHLTEGLDKLVGVEDCLFLNVYTTSVESTGEKLPIIFFIHGGAFMFGYGHFYQPDYILREPMVFVTVNYRLGPLGFLSTEDTVIPGNYGMKDQVLALEWVQKNIKNFNGDPNKVTIVGFSAGGASVHLHYMSPLTKGLFQNGIAHSGMALNPWVFMEQANEKTQGLAANLNCPTENSEKILNCLRTKPAKEIVSQVEEHLDILYNPFSPFGLVVEKEHNEGPFITDWPTEILKRGNIHKLPLVVSYTEDEGTYPASEFLQDEKYLKNLDDNWGKLVGSILQFKHSMPEEKKREVAKIIRAHYKLDGEPLNKETFPKLLKMVSDRLYLSGGARSVKLQQAHAPVYVYFYRFPAVLGFGQFLSHSNDSLGVGHGDDLITFYRFDLRDKETFSDEEKAIGSYFIDFYHQFAKEGKPIFGDVDMIAMDCSDHVKYLEILTPKSISTKIAENFGDEEFWHSLGFDEQ